jgi:hypothetical protein
VPGTATAESESPWRVRIAVALLVATAVLSAARLAVQVAALALHDHPDEVAGYEERLRALRPLLPPHGVVGYLTDRPDAVKEFYLTQYALAPVIVAPDTHAELVVGNFFDPEAASALAVANRLTPIQDLGGGLVLYGGPGR